MERNKDPNSYSPEGRIYQIEYAMIAMTHGTTCLGYDGGNFRVLVSEKKILNTLQVPSSINKHIKICDSIVMGFSGISSDTRSIIEKARNYCLRHLFRYGEEPDVLALAKHLCDLALNFGENEWTKKIFGRPFGVNLLLAGDKLVSVDPSGSYRRYRAKSIGSNIEISVGDYDIENAILYLLKVLGENMRDKISIRNVDVAYVDENGVKILTQDEIGTYIEKLNK